MLGLGRLHQQRKPNLHQSKPDHYKQKDVERHDLRQHILYLVVASPPQCRASQSRVNEPADGGTPASRPFSRLMTATCNAECRKASTIASPARAPRCAMEGQSSPASLRPGAPDRVTVTPAGKCSEGRASDLTDHGSRQCERDGQRACRWDRRYVPASGTGPWRGRR